MTKLANCTAEDIINADDAHTAAFMAEMPHPMHEDAVMEALKHHWGIVLCSCCIDGYHDA